MRRLWLFALLGGVCITAGVRVRASDATAAYVVVSRLVFEPNTDAPERVQIWGAFAMAKPNDRNDYLEPQRGYLYVQVPSANAAQARLEWRDLQGSAGKRQIIGFGSRYTLNARLRSADETPRAPDTYTLASGLYRIRTDTSYPPMKALLDFSAR